MGKWDIAHSRLLIGRSPVITAVQHLRLDWIKMRTNLTIKEIMIERGLAYLERDVLRNIVPLKMLRSHPEACRVQMISSDDGEGVLIELNPKAFAYDREHYAHADGIILVSSDHSRITNLLLAALPHDNRWVFKLQSEADALELQDRFQVRHVNAFWSFTDTKPLSPGKDARVTLEPTREMFRLYAERDYGRQWLESLINVGKAFCCELGDAQSVCLAFENTDNIWEVGGVYTPEPLRGRGLAARVVSACIAELQTRGLRTRYQVEESNPASIAVARKIGLEHFLTVTHFETQTA